MMRSRQLAATHQASAWTVCLACFLGASASAQPLPDRTAPQPFVPDVLIERLENAVPASTVLAAPIGAGSGAAFRLSAGSGGVSVTRLWLSGHQTETRGPVPELTGFPVAAATLSESSLAVIVRRGAAVEPLASKPEPRLVFLQLLLGGGIDRPKEVPLPATVEGGAWSIAATQRRLFLASGGRLLRSRYTSSGVGASKPYAELDRPVHGLVVDPKGYLVALTADDGQEAILHFFDPTVKRATPLCSYPMTLPGAGPIAYASAQDEPHATLFVASPAGLHRVELAFAGDGPPVAKAVLVWRPPAPIQAIAGQGPSTGTRPLTVLAGETLYRVTPASALR